jgi:hypothetical protein
LLPPFICLISHQNLLLPMHQSTAESKEALVSGWKKMERRKEEALALRPGSASQFVFGVGGGPDWSRRGCGLVIIDLSLLRHSGTSDQSRAMCTCHGMLMEMESDGEYVVLMEEFTRLPPPPPPLLPASPCRRSPRTRGRR